MTSFEHDRPVSRERGSTERRRLAALGVHEMWPSVAIIVMWLAVLFDAVFGPDIVTASATGDRAAVPSAIFVAAFAFLATWVVVRWAFRHDRR